MTRTTPTVAEDAPALEIRQRPCPEVASTLPADLPAILQRVYRARGVAEPRLLDRSLKALAPGASLSGLERAVQRLCALIERRGRILIVGDFDADGATSSALCVLGLRALGHAAVDYLVPNRFEFGYGLTPEIVALAVQRAPDLILTVDNGISSHAGVEAARQAGIEVVITDHHLPGERLPDAAAIVNPNQPGDGFPSKALAGVGVALYLLLGVRAALRQSGWFERRGIEAPNLAELLDLVALGTVADVVPLDHNNRILVYQGLARIRQGRCRPGILALLQVAGRDHQRIQANDLGFAVGPRLNAAGRLDDMSRGIECLLAEDQETALQLARELDRLNRERRTIEQAMQQQADALLAQWQFEDAELPWGLCLHRADWHQGVIGILASRIKERYHRPVIAFADAGDGNIKGSARSVPGLHIRDALDTVAARHPRLLQKFGGHAMAAGMTLRGADFNAFAAAFDQVVREQLSPSDLQPLLLSDGDIPVAELTLETAAALAAGGPWGQAFAEPLFDDEFDILSGRVVGERHWKLLLRHASGAPVVDGIAFNAVEAHPQLPARVHLAYRLDINTWRGQSSLQLRVEHMQPTGNH